MPLYSWFDKKQQKRSGNSSSKQPTFTTDGQVWPVAKVSHYHTTNTIKSLDESKSTSLITIDDEKPGVITNNIPS